MTTARILACTDGSDYSFPVYQMASWAARELAARVDVLYVTDLRQFEVPLAADISGSLGLQPYGAVLEQLREIEAQKAQVLESVARDAFAKAGITEVSFRHETGLLLDRIEEDAEAFDLIVVGKRGETEGFARDHLGSNLERILRASRVPVLVAPKEPNEIQHLGLAYDGGPAALRAIDFLCEKPLAQSTRLTLIRVKESNADETSVAETMEQARQRLLSAGRTVETRLMEVGDVEDQLVAAIERIGVDLLVMGAYGHNKLRKLFLGSTTSELLERVRLPILCIR